MRACRSRTRCGRRSRGTSGQALDERAAQLARRTIRRVEEDEAERPRLPCVAQRRRARRARRTVARQRRASAEVGARSRPTRAGRVDEDGARGAARERLEAERAGAGEQVEHRRRRRAAPRIAEERLAHAVGGGARAASRGGAAMRRPAEARRRRSSSAPASRSTPRRAKRLRGASLRRAARARARRGSGSRSSSAAARSRASSSSARSSGMRATLNTGRPCWRVPRSWPSPRSSRSSSASSKPSRARGDRLEPPRRLGSGRTGSSATRARRGRPPAQLVELREAEALGVLDHHHRGVGHVDADLDHGGGDEHVGVAGGEGRHRLRLARASGIWPWMRPRGGRGTPCAGGAPPRRWPRAPAASRTPRRAGRRRRPGGPCASSSRIALVGALAGALAVHHVRLDRLAARGQLAQRARRRGRRRRVSASVRGIGVAVMWSACSARPPGALASSAAALAHAEAVLLVDDRERQVARTRPRARAARACRRRAPSSPRGELPRISRRRAAGVAPVSSAIGTRPRQQPRRAWPGAARPASRWAPSAPPGRRSRPRAASRGARRRSCPTRPRPSAGGASGSDEARSASIRSKAARWSPVGANGSDASQGSTSSPTGSSTRAGRPSRRARRRADSASSSRNSSSKASRRRASSSSDCSSGKCAAASAAGRSASRSAARM